jgi:hypothetical protein
MVIWLSYAILHTPTAAPRGHELHELSAQRDCPMPPPSPPASQVRTCDAGAAQSPTRGTVSEMARCFSSSNLASRVFDRQLISPRPGATVRFLL